MVYITDSMYKAVHCRDKRGYLLGSDLGHGINDEVRRTYPTGSIRCVQVG